MCVNAQTDFGEDITILAATTTSRAGGLGTNPLLNARSTLRFDRVMISNFCGFEIDLVRHKPVY